VSLFGPGVGEGVVIHVGGGDWIIVDSCVERAPKRPVALRYLEDLSVDVATAVKLQVVTHWHDDHIRGAAAVLRRARSTRFACSAALRSQEFFQLTALSDRTMAVWPGSAEFSEILEILAERAPAGVRPASVGPDWATADRRLWQRIDAAPCPVQVYSLSPSDASITLALREFAQLVPREGTPKHRLIAQRPNEVAVVLWIEAGAIRIVLGSDLENTGNPATGWQALLASAARPSGQAQIFKIPHHGSANADHPGVWGDMLLPNPHAALTPYTRGRFLPQPQDIARLKGRTPHLYCTARPGGWTPPRRDPAVEKILREAVRERRALSGPMGHVRIRARCSDPNPTRVELFDGAYAP
jgi:hypothetical protein